MGHIDKVDVASECSSLVGRFSFTVIALHDRPPIFEPLGALHVTLNFLALEQVSVSSILKLRNSATNDSMQWQYPDKCPWEVASQPKLGPQLEST